MAIKVNYIDNGKGIEIVATGSITGKDIISAHKKIYAADTLAEQRYHIIDKSKCTEYNVTAADIEAIAQLDREAARVNANIIIAFVESRSLEFSLSEVWQAYVEAFIQHSKTFANRSDAEQWIRETID